MSVPQAQGGYTPQPTYPAPSYGQPQQAYPPTQAGYSQPYQQQSQYPGYQQPQAVATPAPAPKKGGGLLKIWAILALVGLVLAGVGFLVVGAEFTSINNCGYSSSGCTLNGERSAENTSLIGIMVIGVGFAVSGVGIGLYFLALPKKLEEIHLGA